MTTLNRDELIGKFWNGETSLEEEKFLKQTWDDADADSPDKTYFDFIGHQPEAPVSLENEIWEKLQVHTPFRRLPLFKWSVAASLTLLIGIGAYVGHQHQMEKRRNQFVLLENTLNYVSKQVDPNAGRDVLYEDNLIVIVADND
jgi:hypothetical protein